MGERRGRDEGREEKEGVRKHSPKRKVREGGRWLGNLNLFPTGGGRWGWVRGGREAD